MKKSVSIILVTILVFGIVLASAPLQVQAKPLESVTPNPLIAGGSWTSGSEADVAALVGSAPTWLQWLANGVKVTEAGKICHPLRGGQFGWIGQIMQYKDGKWVKLATTNDWVPNKEGEFMACAQAPAAGTYALFGYWIRPAGYVESPQSVCASLSWSDVTASADGNIIFNGYLTTVPIPTTVTFLVAASNVSALVGQTGTYTITTADGNFWGNAGFSGDGVTSLTVIFTESNNNCSSGELIFSLPPV